MSSLLREENMRFIKVVGTAFAVVTVVFWILSKENRSTFTSYMQTVSGIAFIIAIISLRSQIERDQTREEKEARAEFVQKSYETFGDRNRLFIDNYPYLDRFNQELNRIGPIRAHPDVDVEKDIVLSHHVATTIIQQLESIFITMGGFKGDWSTSEGQQWIRTWRHWFGSRILREQWEAQKDFFSADVAKFIDTQIIPFAESPDNYDIEYPRYEKIDREEEQYKNQHQPEKYEPKEYAIAAKKYTPMKPPSKNVYSKDGDTIWTFGLPVHVG